MVSIFIFRRDFRLHDNIGLIKALQESVHVLPIFIFTPEQLVNNKYKSDNSVQFMMESLEDLEEQIKEKDGKLYYFYGQPDKVIEKLIKNNKIQAVYFNEDYTPYSVKRDESIRDICFKNNVECNVYEDILLNPVGSIRTKTSDSIYTKFTPYFNTARKNKVDKPLTNKFKKYSKQKIIGTYDGKKTKFYKNNLDLFNKGGREEALKILRNIDKFKDYNKTRNCLDQNTTYLSAYIKYGCVSIREVYWAFMDKLGSRNDLIKQLYWRDFYYNIMYEFPDVLNHNMKPQYDKIKWNQNIAWFNKWKKGETGYPIVDAGMRQMNQTGFMHNRARLIVSNFLIKLLGIDWKKGEIYFTQTLYDIDPSVNNGNWQWSSGTGADSQPYFRIFNPWTQGEKFDPKAVYIKKWVPELEDVDAKDIHHWDNTWENYDVDYPAPMIDYNKQRERGLSMYKRALSKS